MDHALYLQGSEALQQGVAVLRPSAGLRLSRPLCGGGGRTLQAVLLLPHLLQEFVLNTTKSNRIIHHTGLSSKDKTTPENTQKLIKPYLMREHGIKNDPM